MPEVELIDVEVAYARSDQQMLLRVRVPPGTTAGQAIDASGILDHFPKLDWKNTSIGIFGKVCKPEHILNAGDRVEVYRPLLMDPMQQRRQRAAKSRTL